MDFKKDYYQILGVEPDASREALKAAHRRLAKAYHPDRAGVAGEERMKEINEAWDVLGDSAEKAIYDEFLKKIQSVKDEAKASGRGSAESRHVRSYEREYTVTVIEKIYVRGKIRVKFWAAALNPDALHLNVVDFKLNPVEALVQVDERNLDIRVASSEFQAAVSQSEIFASPLTQPIPCEVTTPTGVVKYKLELLDVRISNAELVDINKYEDQSFGTLVGNVFAEVAKPKQTVHTEQVTECFGPTGRHEKKLEDGWNWQRSEYYHSDCTTYWGAWEKVSEARHPAEPVPEEDSTKVTEAKKSAPFETRFRDFRESIRHPLSEKSMSNGCGPWILIPLGILALILVPQLILPALSYGLLILLLTTGARMMVWFRVILPYLFLLFIGLAVFTALHNANRSGGSSPGLKRSSIYDTTVSQREVVRTKLSPGSSEVTVDTFIRQRIRWMNYDSAKYEVTLSVPMRTLRQSVLFHQELANAQPRSIGTVYSEMDYHDTKDLDLVYASFDSIRVAAKLNELSFAKMLVSCIQSIPYYLVLDQSCAPGKYQDEFIRKYLLNCTGDCCVGNVLYGVRTPVEFLSDLKGDCDTRALFLYTVLRHFNYDVALMTSEYYHHAALAVGLQGNTLNVGSFVKHGEKIFYMWETTNKGFQPGVLPAPVGDLSKWTITLINE